MLKKLLRGIFELAMLAGLLYAIPQAVRAGAEGSLALVGISDLTVTVDQEILCSPCMGTIHWGDPAGNETVVYPDDNTSDQSFTYAQAGCYEPVLTIHNEETLEEASYSAGKLPVGPDASCPVEAPVLRYFPQIIHQEMPTATPTPTPTITPTPTVTPTPSATADTCPGDPIDDPSFEARCGWEFSGILDPWYTRSPRKAGERSLGLGVRPGEDDDIAGYSQAYQWVTIPDWADTLKGYYYAESEETGASAARPPELGLIPRWGWEGGNQLDRAVDTDTIFLYLSRSYDDDIRRVIWKPNYDHPSWQSFEAEISFLRGQTILLIFGLGTDGDGRASRVYFDDFSVH